MTDILGITTFMVAFAVIAFACGILRRTIRRNEARLVALAEEIRAVEVLAAEVVEAEGGAVETTVAEDPSADLMKIISPAVAEKSSEPSSAEILSGLERNIRDGKRERTAQDFIPYQYRESAA